MLGLSDFHPIRDFLNGEQPLESPAEALIAMAEQLNPELVIIDAPPVPMSDDVLALPQLDAVLFVVAAPEPPPTTCAPANACLTESDCARRSL